jgi:hypothetical protein
MSEEGIKHVEKEGSVIFLHRERRELQQNNNFVIETI